jgi:cullin 1
VHLLPGPAIIYENLADFLVQHLQSVVQRLQSVDNGLLLEAYLAEWDRYAAAANRLNRLLELINRHYVLRNIDEGKDGIYKIRTLHFVQWRAHVWEKVSDSVIDAALRTIERGDEKAASFNDILERFASLGVDDSPSSESDPRGSVRNKLEAAFVPEIEAHERKIQQRRISFPMEETYVEG